RDSGRKSSRHSGKMSPTWVAASRRRSSKGSVSTRRVRLLDEVERRRIWDPFAWQAEDSNGNGTRPNGLCSSLFAKPANRAKVGPSFLKTLPICHVYRQRRGAPSSKNDVDLRGTSVAADDPADRSSRGFYFIKK